MGALHPECPRRSTFRQHVCVPRSIGGANYRSFMALLVAALALAGLQAAVSALQLAASWHGAQHAHWLGGVSESPADGGDGCWPAPADAVGARRASCCRSMCIVCTRASLMLLAAHEPSDCICHWQAIPSLAVWLQQHCALAGRCWHAPAALPAQRSASCCSSTCVCAAWASARTSLCCASARGEPRPTPPAPALSPAQSPRPQRGEIGERCWAHITDRRCGTNSRRRPVLMVTLM